MCCNCSRSRQDQAEFETEYERGGRFASMQLPEVAATDVRAFFAGVRTKAARE
jgi:hypothetical protein